MLDQTLNITLVANITQMYTLKGLFSFCVEKCLFVAFVGFLSTATKLRISSFVIILLIDCCLHQKVLFFPLSYSFLLCSWFAQTFYESTFNLGLLFTVTGVDLTYVCCTAVHLVERKIVFVYSIS